VATELSIAATFAARLSLLMAERGESQAELGRDDAIPHTQQAISRILAEKSLPKVDLVVAVARRYDVSTDWLLGLSAERRPLSRIPFGWVDDEAFAKVLADDPAKNRSLRSGQTVIEPFPPHARLVDETEFRELQERLRATHKQGLGERLRARLRGRPKKGSGNAPG
jgi:transcriptional regulator with XRE-family HTH domain